MIHVEALTIGKVQARIVAVSHIGIHARVEDWTAAYGDAIKRLAVLTQTWNQR